MPSGGGHTGAIDPVVNVWERQDFEVYPDHLRDFWERIRIEEKGTVGIDIEEMLARMDAARIEIAFLLATRGGEWELTYRRGDALSAELPGPPSPPAGEESRRLMAGLT